ncbi:hypothetical protein ARAM_002292 [Aspergillus rambellii]|uniref:Uncharacterized protein n=1 Tax=Aspergillus rambellii TaxID=308745 RepID=A0A0F8XCZ1_9EURO|nr:hypothetical protein ARAM_002292 [Aspergillus rambellii]
MSDNILLKERLARRKVLAEIYGRVLKTPSHHIDKDILQEACIQYSTLSLQEEPDLEPYYFKPYAGDLPLPEDPDNDLGSMDCDLLRDNHISNARTLQLVLWDYAYHCGMLLEEQNLQHLSPFRGYRETGDFKFGNLFEVMPNNWEVPTVLDTREGKFPHMKAMVISNTIGDNRLLRGELLAITDIMSTRLRTIELRPHIVAPILIFSIIGVRHARVLEAHFNGKDLIVRCSKLYDFSSSTPDLKPIRLLARYWLGSPCGETTWEEIMGVKN